MNAVVEISPQRVANYNKKISRDPSTPFVNAHGLIRPFLWREMSLSERQQNGRNVGSVCKLRANFLIGDSQREHLTTLSMPRSLDSVQGPGALWRYAGAIRASWWRRAWVYRVGKPRPASSQNRACRNKSSIGAGH